MSTHQAGGTVRLIPVRVGWVGVWQHWTAEATVAWSLVYGALGIYWAVSGNGFPYAPTDSPNLLGSVLSRLGPVVAWVVIMLAGIPAAVLGVAMRRNVKGAWRPLFIAAGAILSAILLLAIPDLALLESLGYVPFTVFRFLTGADTGYFLRMLAGSGAPHQLLCLLGGFLWLAATVSYARRSSDACLYCGRSDAAQGWQSPEAAARWGRVAVYVAMVAPLFYGFTRYAWAMGWPLGMTHEYWQSGHEKGLWLSGLFLASFGLVGALLMLGLVQRWGEVLPRWMVGLAGRRVPIALAVVPASLVSVVVFVGGIAIWSGIPQMNANVAATGWSSAEIRDALVFQLGPTLLFPMWGIALAVATLGYYFRRRGPCKVCGRGA